MSTRLESLSGRGRRDAPTQTSALAGLARGAVHKRLARLRYGSIEISDTHGRYRFGRGDDSLHASIHVTDPRFYVDCASGGNLGIARAWMDGYWRSENLTEVFRVALANIDVFDGMETGLARVAQTLSRWHHARRANTESGSRGNIYAHYDLGNDLFTRFLDSTMTYSAAIFEHADEDLAVAQTRKLDRICKKLNLQAGHRVLEVGCGWGSFAIHAARNYGCHVTATTISQAQFDYAQKAIKAAGLENKIDLLLQDYRRLDGSYDRVVSIEMIEAVGHEFLPEYFGTCARLLRQDGAMCLQSISMPDQRYARYLRTVDFIKAYIFPGCCVPSQNAMLDAVSGASDMSVIHIEDMAPHYAETLRRWRQHFFENLAEIQLLGYSPRFARLWDYYLQYCEAGFDERYLGSLQIVLTKPGSRLQPEIGPLPTLNSKQTQNAA